MDIPVCTSVSDGSADFVTPSGRFIRCAYGVRKSVGMSFSGEGRTRQDYKDEADINVIMKRYAASGVLPDFLNKGEGQYLDCTGHDFDQAMQVVAQASSMFHELPSAIRDRFQNSPAAFLNFCHDPANAQEMLDMGLRKAPERFIDTSEGGDKGGKPKAAPKAAKSVSSDSAQGSESE